MSNYSFTARHKETGKIVEVMAADDYFGKHRYGFILTDGDVFNEDAFSRLYERLDITMFKGIIPLTQV